MEIYWEPIFHINRDDNWPDGFRMHWLSISFPSRNFSLPRNNFSRTYVKLPVLFLYASRVSNEVRITKETRAYFPIFTRGCNKCREAMNRIASIKLLDPRWLAFTSEFACVHTWQAVPGTTKRGGTSSDE